MNRRVIGNLLDTTHAMWFGADCRPAAGVVRLRHCSFAGSYVHPSDGVDYRYEVDSRIAVDPKGRESMHLRGRVRRGNASVGFVVLGHVEPEQSFFGREQSVALDCVAVTCARLSGWCHPAARPGAPMPTARATDIHAAVTLPA